MRLSRLFNKCLHAAYVHIENSADYALERVGTVLYIYFQDSDGLEDWKNNLKFPAKPYERMGKTVWFAHSGFLSVWQAIQGYIRNDIMDKSIKKIIIVGYSHGAAVAALCHEYAWLHRPELRDTIEGYGFGCPRVFWGIEVKWLKERWARFYVIRNLDDIVTHVPPALLGYSHIGEMIEIGSHGKYSAIDAHRPENILKELYNYESKNT